MQILMAPIAFLSMWMDFLGWPFVLPFVVSAVLFKLFVSSRTTVTHKIMMYGAASAMMWLLMYVVWEVAVNFPFADQVLAVLIATATLLGTALLVYFLKKRRWKNLLFLLPFLVGNGFGFGIMTILIAVSRM